MAQRERIAKTVYFAAAFCILFVFFVQIHPLVVYDTDDWTYISRTRHAFPIWGAWNPTRVMPEVLMPLCGSIAAQFVYPLTGDYFRSITLVAGFLVSGSITVYMYMFSKVLEKKGGLSISRVLLLVTMIFILHFLVLRHGAEGNKHLFYAKNLTCYFYYVIPNVLNSSLVMYLMLDDALANGWDKLRGGVYSRHAVRYGLLVAAIYFALVSNLYASAILASYIGSQLLLELIRAIHSKVRVKVFLQQNFLRFIFLLCWCAVQFFEMNGGRASQAGGAGQSFFQLLRQTLNELWQARTDLNQGAVLLMVLIVLAAAGIFLYRRRHSAGAVRSDGLRTVSLLGLQMGGLAAYLFLVTSVVQGSSVTRPDVLFGVFFCGLLIVSLCAGYLLKRLPALTLAMPLLLCVMFFEINTPGRTFQESTTGYVHPDICVAISEDVLEQLKQADEANMTQMVLYVPKYDSSDNWPYAYYAKNRISKTLYEHGIIRREIQIVQVRPSLAKNEKFSVSP